MWGPGPWGPPMLGFWWIIPLIGFVMCFALLVMIIRVVITGRGAMCMGAHPRTENAEVAEMRREIQTLRDELKEVKAAR